MGARIANDRKLAMFAKYDSMGEDHVRLMVQTPLRADANADARAVRGFAVEWLAQFDQQSRLRSESSQAESLETAKSAKDAAWEAATAAREAAREAKTANIIATLALIAAAIAIAISVIGLFLR
jgi:hypothetical protein